MKPYIEPELVLIDGMNSDMIQTSGGLTTFKSENEDPSYGNRAWNWSDYNF